MSNFVTALNTVSHVRNLSRAGDRLKKAYKTAAAELPLGDRLLARVPYGLVGGDAREMQLRVYGELFSDDGVVLAYIEYVDALEALALSLAPKDAPVAQVIAYLRGVPATYRAVGAAADGERFDAMVREAQRRVEEVFASRAPAAN